MVKTLYMAYSIYLIVYIVVSFPLKVFLYKNDKIYYLELFLLDKEPNGKYKFKISRDAISSICKFIAIILAIVHSILSLFLFKNCFAIIVFGVLIAFYNSMSIRSFIENISCFLILKDFRKIKKDIEDNQKDMYSIVKNASISYEVMDQGLCDYYGEVFMGYTVYKVDDVCNLKEDEEMYGAILFLPKFFKRPRIAYEDRWISQELINRIINQVGETLSIKRDTSYLLKMFYSELNTCGKVDVIEKKKCIIVENLFVVSKNHRVVPFTPGELSFKNRKIDEISNKIENTKDDNAIKVKELIYKMFILKKMDANIEDLEEEDILEMIDIGISSDKSKKYLNDLLKESKSLNEENMDIKELLVYK